MELKKYNIYHKMSKYFMELKKYNIYHQMSKTLCNWEILIFIIKCQNTLIIQPL